MKAKTTLKAERERFGSGPDAGIVSTQKQTRPKTDLTLTATTRSNGKSEIRDANSLKPPLKWAGGKRWLVPHLAALWESHSSRRFVEPFCGGLAIPLGLRPQSAILNDLNPHLINFYTALQQGLEITIEMKNEETTFYRHRKRFNRLIRDGNWRSAEAAQLFYYLNRTCFNGLCRFNKRGGFNVPFGTHKAITYAHNFFEYEQLLRNWHFNNGDIESLQVEPNDFIYADPPYDVLYCQVAACV